MTVRLLIPVTCAAIGVLCLLYSLTPTAPHQLPVIAGDPADGSDEGCKAGCAAVPNQVNRLGHDRIVELLADFGASQSTVALETLLFHGTEVLSHVEHHGTSLASPIDQQLRTELAKTQVRFWLRVVEDDTNEPRFIVDQNVPIGEKQHLHPDTARGIVPPEVSFTVHRVGTEHLWTRL